MWWSWDWRGWGEVFAVVVQSAGGSVVVGFLADEVAEGDRYGWRVEVLYCCSGLCLGRFVLGSRLRVGGILRVGVVGFRRSICWLDDRLALVRTLSLRIFMEMVLLV